MLRHPLISNVSDNIKNRQLDTILSAHAIGKLFSGVTETLLNLDDCVKPGIYRFNTDFVSTASGSAPPFKNKSGYLVVHTVNPDEEPDGDFKSKNMVRQLVYIDDLKADIFTRTGVGTNKVGVGVDATYNTWTWSSKWINLSTSNATTGMIYRVDGIQVTDLNLYIEPGCWIVGKPGIFNSWLNYPDVAGRDNKVGYLVVFTEDDDDEIPNRQTYYQIYYPIDDVDKSPYIRVKRYNSGTWEPWFNISKNSPFYADKATNVTKTINGNPVTVPGIYYIKTQSDFNQYVKNDSLIQDTYPGILMIMNSTHSSQNDYIEIQLYFSTNIEISTSNRITQWIRYKQFSGYYTNWSRLDLAQIPISVTDDMILTKYDINKCLYIYGNHTVTLPNPSTLKIGDKLSVIQCEGSGIVMTQGSNPSIVNTSVDGIEIQGLTLALNNSAMENFMYISGKDYSRTWGVFKNNICVFYDTDENKWRIDYAGVDALADNDVENPWETSFTGGYSLSLNPYMSTTNLLGFKVYKFEVINKINFATNSQLTSTFNEWALHEQNDPSEELLKLKEENDKLREELTNALKYKEKKTVVMTTVAASKPNAIYYDPDEPPEDCEVFTEEVLDQYNVNEYIKDMYLNTYKRCNLAHFNLKIIPVFMTDYETNTPIVTTSGNPLKINNGTMSWFDIRLDKSNTDIKIELVLIPNIYVNFDGEVFNVDKVTLLTFTFNSMSSTVGDLSWQLIVT